MKANKPIRMCFITRKRYPKDKLYRMIKINDKEYTLDLDFNKGGRGIYFCKTIKIENFKKVLEKKNMYINPKEEEIIKKLII